ncbi:MAG: helix-hairpin-helix domain-containing protein [Gaiellales bacterium]
MQLPSRQMVLAALVALAVLAVGWRYRPDASAPAPEPRAAVAVPASAAAPVVVVDVTGAVRRPGVYRLPSWARVQDAVRRAGLRPGARLAGINLAARLADGEQIVVPGRGQPAGVAPPVSGAAGGPVHLNSATLEQLESLDGIGPALAQRILDYRAAHGGFRTLDELDQVSGIGPARLASLAGHVVL